MIIVQLIAFRAKDLLYFIYFTVQTHSYTSMHTYKTVSRSRIRGFSRLFVRSTVKIDLLQMWSLTNLSVGYKYSPWLSPGQRVR